jgi:tRNA(Ile)-lysidine synthase
VLLNLVRGAGLAGIGGMTASAPWPFREQGELRVVRPLMCLSREDTAAYCAAAGIAAIEDESNASAAYRRNRVRHEVLPLLRTLNPRVDEALVRLAEAAQEAAAHLEGEAGRLVDVSSAGEVSINRKLFPIFLPSMRAQAVRAALRDVAGDLEGFSARNIDAVEALVLEGRTGDRLDLPHGLTAHLTREALVLRKGESEAQSLPDGVVTLSVPGEARLGELAVSAGERASGDGAVCVKVDAAALGSTLAVRRRREGDRMQPLGMSGTKKLQDIFVDALVPRESRDAVPVFENERGIVWLGGLRVAEWARAREGEPAVTLAYRAAGTPSP